MFTGIIRSIGTVVAVQRRGHDIRLRLDGGKLDLADARIGDSIAVSGVCLTVIHLAGSSLDFDVSRETVARTTLGELRPGSQVNLETALTLKDRLGGHLVSGHCDGMGTLLERKPEGESVQFSIRAPENLARYIAEKGSICVDGVSLTVNEVQGSIFGINIVPHTLQETTLKEYCPGYMVNLEVDLLARYVERLLPGNPAAATRQNIDQAFLAQHGFAK